jgi:hypothetical protein
MSGKRVPFVFDECESSRLAEAAWRQAPAQLGTEEARLLPQFVGFPTSGHAPCMSSAILVSAEPGLVYLCDNGEG